MTETLQAARVLVLGPVTVVVGTESVAPSSPLGRAVLGALAAADGRPIGTESLARLLGHADAAGPGARTAVQVAVHRLRRWLEQTTGGTLSIETTGGGYALPSATLDTDLRRFRRLVSRATAMAGSDRAAMLQQALSLWRDAPLADVPDDRRDPDTIAQLEREQVAAGRLYAVAAIAQGAGEEAAAVLAPLAYRDPFDEQIHALLMRALAIAGRPAEALTVYRNISTSLRAELDAAPGPELVAAQLAVLRPVETTDDEPAVATPVDLLPPPVRHFTGRSDLLVRLHEQVRAWAADSGTCVAAISGRPGVGKTALAVWAAHELADAFPGGRLYVDLRGAEAVPLDPHEVLGRFLRALSVPVSTIPEPGPEREALYRSRLADRRTLVILDNAADEDQVRGLLPGAGCVVFVTSRTRLNGLAGASQLEVENLSVSESVALVTALIGADQRIEAQGAILELVRQCGLLPLALQIVGAQLASNPHWTVARLTGVLADERRRLDRLSFDDLDVRATFNLSYTGLAEPARRLFRYLAELDLVDFPAWVGQALLDRPAGQTEALDELVEARFVDVAATDALGQPRLLLHDLIRLFGRERGRQEDTEAATRAALGRVFDGWLYLSQQVEAAVTSPSGWAEPPRRPRPSAIDPVQGERLLAERRSLLTVERDRLVRATVQACVLDLLPVGWELAASMVHYWETTCGWDDWRHTHELALAAIRRSDDQAGKAVILFGLAACYHELHRGSVATDLFRQAGAAFRAAGDIPGEAETLRLLGTALRRAGSLDEAEAASTRALELFAVWPAPGFEESFLWWNLAWIDMQRRQFGRARQRMDRALELYRGDYPRHLGFILHGYAMLEYWAGRYDAGVQWAEREMALWTETRERRGAAFGLLCLGQNLTGLGRYDEARLALLDSFALMDEFGQLDGLAQAHTALATLHRLIGDPNTALEMMERALEFCAQVESPTHNAEAWMELAEVHDALAQPGPARAARERALTFLDRTASPLAIDVRSRL